MHCLKFAIRKNLICLYEERKAQNHVLNLGLCEVYVNESIFCDICKNGSNFLFIDFIATPFALNVIFRRESTRS